MRPKAKKISTLAERKTDGRESHLLQAVTFVIAFRHRSRQMGQNHARYDWGIVEKYEPQPSFEIAEEKVLICCAKPQTDVEI